jgi:hypothetical protein
MELSQASSKLEGVLEDLACQTEAFHDLEKELYKLQGERDMLNIEIEALRWDHQKQQDLSGGLHWCILEQASPNCLLTSI